MAYSLDLRERITTAVKGGESKPKVAKRFAVSLSTVKRYVKLSKAGNLEGSKPPGQKSWLDAEGEKVLLQQVEEHNDWTLEQHAEGLYANTGVKVKKSAIAKYFKRLKITRKKKPSS